MNKKIVIGILVLGVLITGYMVWPRTDGRNLDTFATCLKDKGIKFYGAFWCPHCQNQKKLFGSAASNLPYVECSTPDGKAQNQTCKDKNIQGYPTWEFADGSRESGEVTLEKLAEKSQCTLPPKS